jgi:hypothetical protein
MSVLSLITSSNLIICASHNNLYNSRINNVRLTFEYNELIIIE